MKKHLYLPLIIVISLANLQAQNYLPGEDGFTYKVNGLVYLMGFDKEKGELDGDTYYAEEYLFNKVGLHTVKLKVKDQNDSTKEKEVSVDYYLLKIGNFTYGEEVEESRISKLAADNTFKIYGKKIDDTYKLFSNRDNTRAQWVPISEKKIDRSDANKYFAITVAEFNKLISEKIILKRYNIGFGNYGLKLIYGAQLSVPFKLRPSINEEPLRLTPEISLGGFFGSRVRIKRYEDTHWIPLFVSAGVGAVGVNQNNTIDESTITGENQVLAFNFSVGSLVKLKDFQIGVVAGWDKATGDLGKEWVYQGRPWFSLAIGYNFLEFGSKKSIENGNNAVNN